MTQPLTEQDPTRLGDYTVVARLGSGGMGTVYLGQTPRGAPVAIKLIKSELADDPRFQARFRREVDAAVKVSSPYTARVLDADTHSTPPYLVTEYVAGDDLEAHVRRRGSFSGEQLKALAAATAAALASIHRVGVVHRDLSPRNVMLAADGPRIIDLGVARYENATRVTDTGVAMGTPGWIAPEQLRGDDATAASDVFAWGALLAFAGTGRSPFGHGLRDAMLFRVVHEPPDLDGLPSWLADACASALAKDPSDRPTAEAIARRLTGASDMDATEQVAQLADTLVASTWAVVADALPPTEVVSTRQLTGTAVADPAERATEIVATPAPRRTRALWLAGAAAFVVAGSVAALVYSGSGDTPPPIVASDLASPSGPAQPTPSVTDTTPAMSATPQPTSRPEEAPEQSPAAATAPSRPGLPEAPWDGSSVAPATPELRQAAQMWAEHGFAGCDLYLPTEIESGLGFVGSEFTPLLTRIGDFQVGWEAPDGNSSVFAHIWPPDSQAVVPYFDNDPDGTEFADGSVMRSGTEFGDRLLAIPGQDCFYEFSVESMVALDWTFYSYRRLTTD